MRILNACLELDTVFPRNLFRMDNWVKYIDGILADSSVIFTAESEKYDFDSQCLPVIQNALIHLDKRAEVIVSFETVTKGLDEKIKSVFERAIDADIILYLGLCHGAGWVTEFGGRTVVLLGIEKIIELDWCSERDIYGLIYHELGHVYQKQYGILERKCVNSADDFLWQLFIEGIAMHFEQMLIGDLEFYHQDKGGWKTFMDAHFEELKRDFYHDLHTMDSRTQRYFGDWTKYHGFGDAGYYLGAKFVRFILKSYDFEYVISFNLPEVKSLFGKFVQSS